jgi:hypothetical protein
MLLNIRWDRRSTGNVPQSISFSSCGISENLEMVSSGMRDRVFSLMGANVLEEPTVSIFRVRYKIRVEDGRRNRLICFWSVGN